jgi:site-specific DNA-methyltransferase (adenine-specific)
MVDQRIVADKIFIGDCRTILPLVDTSSVNLVITSPPYNLGIIYDSVEDKREWKDYYAWCRLWLSELFRVLKPDGRLCLNHYLSCGSGMGGEVTISRSGPLMTLNCICEDIGFKHHGLAIWDDRTITKLSAWGSWLSSSAPYINSPFEGILILYKERWKRDTEGETVISKKEFMEACSGIWKLQPEHKDRSKHPAPFPISLPRRCIKLFSYKGDLVLDPFNGVGATTLAAKLEGRHYIGIDISPAYCNEAESKLNQSTIESWFEIEGG